MYKLTFHLRISPAEGRRPVQVWINDEPLSPAASQAIYNHSPDGFEYGYNGSGPAQLALAICLYAFGNNNKAQMVYQEFKRLYVAQWPEKKPIEVDIDLTDFMLDHLDQLGEAEEREQNQFDSIGEQLLEEANFLINPKPEQKTFRIPQRPPKPESRFNLGDIVQVHRSYFGEDPEGLAIVYDREESGYIYLLTREGVDLGAFRPDEQDEQTLTWIQATPGFSYTFRSSSYLERDIRAGAFLQYFPAP